MGALTHHAQVSSSGLAQLMGLLRIVAGAGLGALQQTVGNTALGLAAAVFSRSTEQEQTGKNGKHVNHLKNGAWKRYL